MAGSFEADKNDDIISDINITPFVDVVLVLLVIFMVTAGIIAKRGIAVSLPQAQTAETLNTAQTLEITISKEGLYFINNEEKSLTEIQNKALEQAQNQARLSITINADRNVAYNKVVEVMDALRSIGITEFNLALEAADK